MENVVLYRHASPHVRQPARCAGEFAALWQRNRILMGAVVNDYVDDTHLVGRPRMTSNIYDGLQECNDKRFVLHFLRPGNLSVNISANVGHVKNQDGNQKFICKMA